MPHRHNITSENVGFRDSCIGTTSTVLLSHLLCHLIMQHSRSHTGLHSARSILFVAALAVGVALVPPTASAQNAAFTASPTANPDLSQEITLDGTASSGDSYVWTVDGTRTRTGIFGDGGLTFDTSFASTGRRTVQLSVFERNRCDPRDPGCEPVSVDSTSKTLHVTNPPPTASNDHYSTSENARTSGNVLDNDHDPNGDDLSASKRSSPSKGTVTSFNSNGAFTYDPDREFESLGGSESENVTFEYRASDGRGGSDQATVTVTINGVNDAPTASNASLSTSEDQANTIDLAGSVTDVDDRDGNLGLSIATSPSHGSTSIHGQTVTYTPATNYNGSDHFTYEVSDGSKSATATVDVSVSPVNDPPTASNAALSTSEDQSETVDLSGKVHDPDDGDSELSLSIGSGPSHGSIQTVSGLTVTYAPDQNYSGSDNFTYTVSDPKGKTATATVSVSVSAVNARPTAEDASMTVKEDRSATLNLAPKVADEETDDTNLTLSIESAPSHGQASVSGLDVTYSPHADYNGSDQFTYKVSDGAKSATATVHATISQRPDIAFTDGHAYTPPSPTPGTDRNPVGRFSLTADEATEGGAPAALKTVTIENTAGSSASGIAELELWRSSDASFDPISGSDSEIAAKSYGSSPSFSGTETFSMNEAIPTGGKKYVFVVVDLQSSAQGQFRPAISNENQFSFVNGDLSAVNGSDDSTFAGAPLASSPAPLPVELASFEGRLSHSNARLTWTTASETNNAEFRLQRRTGTSTGARAPLTGSKGTGKTGTPRSGASDWKTVATIEGHGTTSEPQSYRFTDESIPYAADTLSYRLKQVDTDGRVVLSDPIVVGRTVSGVRVESVAPNPAHSRVTVRYAVLDNETATIRLYDVLGRQLRTVVSNSVEGRQKTTLDLSGVPSGLYLVRLHVGDATKTERLTVVK